MVALGVPATTGYLVSDPGDDLTRAIAYLHHPAFHMRRESGGPDYGAHVVFAFNPETRTVKDQFPNARRRKEHPFSRHHGLLSEKQNLRVGQPDFSCFVPGVEDRNVAAREDTARRAVLGHSSHQFSALGFLVRQIRPAEPDVVSHPRCNLPVAIDYANRPRVTVERERARPDDKPGCSPSGGVGGNLNKQTPFPQNQLSGEVVPAPVGSQGVVMSGESHG